MGAFDTLHQFDSIEIPMSHWNTGSVPEPITSSYPQFGNGGATQPITSKPIENFSIETLKGGK